MTHSAWWLVCDALAVYRLAVLITKDTITHPLRELAELPFRRQQKREAKEDKPPALSGFRWYLVELSTCTWCVSIWLAAGVVALTCLAPTVWQYGAVALTLSAVAGFLAER